MSEAERAAALQTCRAAAIGHGRRMRQSPGSRRKGTDRLGRARQPVLLKLTSGTTAAPRAIRFRSAQLLADAEQICDTMGITRADLNFAVIPLSHSYGFSNLVTPLLVRGVPMAISRDRIPRAVLDDLARTEATVFPGMPIFYQAFAEMAEAPALPKLRLCISAGAPLTRPVAREFREKFGRTIHSFYGASECGGICYDREGEGRAGGFRRAGPAGCRNCNRSSRTRRRRQFACAARRWATAIFHEPDPEKLGNGFFHPDDLVTIDKDGVRIVGRLSDVINVAGKKVNPAEVEAHLLGHVDVRAAVVFGRASSLRNEEVVACVVVAEKETDEAALLEFCRARLSGWQVPKRIFLLDALPLNERGKISRRELAAHFAAA